MRTAPAIASHGGLAAIFLGLSAPLAYAQSVTSGPPPTGIPVDHPFALLVLFAGLCVLAARALRRTHRNAAFSLLLAGTLTLFVVATPGLRAQLVSQFTNPTGETLPVPVSPIASGDDVAGFEPADFHNASGANLSIAAIDAPTFAQCFPAGLDGELLPPAAPGAVPATCVVGNLLPDGANCRVDVDAICREQAETNLGLLSVTGSPLTLTANGPTGQLTVTNGPNAVAAQSIVSSFTGTALDGNVTETGNTCASLAPGSSCTLTFTPGNTVVAETGFTLSGSNTNTITARIEIESGSTLTAVSPSSGTASGGTGVTLTGTGLSGATGVTFDGVEATSVNVVNSTTVTAVTPAHATGTVDVVIATPAGGATLSNGFTYLTTAVGQAASGGTLACLNGGGNNLIAVTADNSTGIEWGGFGTAIGASAQSTTDGATNTTAIVNALGNNGGTPYAAQLCSDYEVDSQGNTPCQDSNTCYDDWFLPAQEQLSCLFTNRVAIGGFGTGTYWSSTELSVSPANDALIIFFDAGANINQAKNSFSRLRCVRAFTP